MLSLISFILVSIGCINWFTIGILQFDFVAGIFGSQSNIFSRLIYTLVGIASIIMIANFVTNKGKFVVSFKKADKEYEEFKEMKNNKKTTNKRALATESSEDFSISNSLADKLNNDKNTEADSDMYTNYKKIIRPTTIKMNSNKKREWQFSTIFFIHNYSFC